MNLTIVSYAKGKTGHEQAEAEYLRRLSGHGSVAVEVVRNWQQKDGLPQRQLGNTYAISLYVEGRSYTSTASSEHVGELLQRGTRTSCSPSVAPTACHPGRWSLSSLTFSHGLARLLLLEALYRSFDILRGGNYRSGAEATLEVAHQLFPHTHSSHRGCCHEVDSSQQAFIEAELQCAEGISLNYGSLV